MTITNGEKTMTLEELAQKICNSLFEDNDIACWDGSCPAANHCRYGHNGMIDWLKERLEQ